MTSSCVISSLLGSQITCFPPTNFTLRQAAYVDSFCWAAVEHLPTEKGADSAPLHLHKVMMNNNDISKEVLSCFVFVLFSVSLPAVFSLYSSAGCHLIYIPALFWRFTAVPSLSSDLSFIMEELDRCYNRAIRLAKSLTTKQDKDVAEDPHR